MMDNPHKNHRDRLRKRFLTEGLDSFEYHNVIELLLFYALPQIDTNPIAHEIEKRYPAIDAFFDADYNDLLQIKGLGHNSAVLIKMIPELSRLYISSKTTGGECLDTEEKIIRYFDGAFVGRVNEVMMMLMMDGRKNVIDCRIVATGSHTSANINTRMLIELAVSNRASFIALAHNHPSAACEPSSDDIFLTRRLDYLFSQIDILLVGHYIVTDAECMSINEYIEKKKK